MKELESERDRWRVLYESWVGQEDPPSGGVGSGGGGATSATLKEVRALLMAGSSRVTAEEIQRRQAKEK